MRVVYCSIDENDDVRPDLIRFVVSVTMRVVRMKNPFLQSQINLPNDFYENEPLSVAHRFSSLSSREDSPCDGRSTASCSLSHSLFSQSHHITRERCSKASASVLESNKKILTNLRSDILAHSARNLVRVVARWSACLEVQLKMCLIFSGKASDYQFYRNIRQPTSYFHFPVYFYCLFYGLYINENLIDCRQ